MPVNKGEIVYIGGPITGIPKGNKMMFTTAEIFLKRLGAVVLNPSFLPVGLRDYESYMKICIPMLQEADKLLLLPGWMNSVGAKREHDEARRLLLPVYEFSPTEIGQTPNHFMKLI